MTEEAVGHYCNMTVLEHEGPKAQVHLKGYEHPVWFTQVRDAVAYLRSPEELAEAVVTYVHDMSKADSWAHPGDGAWINAEDAVFVIESARKGGMSAPEAIPFGAMQAAEKFIAENGGRAVHLAEIPDTYVLGPADLTSVNEEETNVHAHMGSMQ
ncbi:nitrous oxide reductase accessory protein NosL [Tepidamorphus sp. 3E244]|uniref:nitrous oxide reductase accessory protein NosL n=1 Tax=Tepidamorphus sp. 3E244 TaxID=3385498 RepID=UPI0038FCA0D3